MPHYMCLCTCRSTYVTIIISCVYLVAALMVNAMSFEIPLANSLTLLVNKGLLHVYSRLKAKYIHTCVCVHFVF